MPADSDTQPDNTGSNQTGTSGTGPKAAREAKRRSGDAAFTPREIVSELDRYIVGQAEAKPRTS